METMNDIYLRDFSKNGNHITMIDTIWLWWKIGNTRNFNGINSYITGATVISNNDFTYSLWVKSINPLQSSPQSLVVQRLTLAAGPLIETEFSGLTGRIDFQMRSNILDGYINISTNSVFLPNIWYNLTFIKNNTSLKIYVNWVLEVSWVYNGGPWNNANIVNFGRDPFDWMRWLNWSLDEVRIYNRALSDSEIQTLYNATK
jgi:hypothetical protein